MSGLSLRRQTYDFLELGSFGSRRAAFFEYFMIALIVANVAAVALETVPELSHRFGIWFQAFNLISVAIFSLEYLARVWSAAERDDGVNRSTWGRRARYMVTPLAVIDLLAVLPFFLGLFGGQDWRVLRIFRLLRLLKLVRYSPALSSLFRVMVAERRALLAALVIMLGLMFFSSTLMYFIEREVQPEAFGDIPSSLWWAIATLTTVGYGDVVPVTAMGQMVGGLVMIFGLAFYALPIGIIASGFSDEVHRREFVLPIRVVEELAIFKKLSSKAAREVAGRARSMVLMPGTVLTHRMDSNNGLYCILSGEVSAFYAHEAVPLQAGDFLGECGLVTEQGSQPSAVIRKRAKLIWIESVDLHMLLAIYPSLSEGLTEHALDRLKDMVEEELLPLEAAKQMMQTLRDGLSPINQE